MYDLVPLNMLRSGQCARVEQVVGLPDQVQRLEELGVRGGTTVEMLQAGSPCIIQLAGNKLCLRSGELLSVLVRLGEPA